MAAAERSLRAAIVLAVACRASTGSRSPAVAAKGPRAYRSCCAPRVARCARVGGLAAAADDHLVKPFDMEKPDRASGRCRAGQAADGRVPGTGAGERRGAARQRATRAMDD